MRLADLLTATEAEAARQLEVCNACRYCEGFCAVFPALQRRTEFSGPDVRQLANLCHNCRDCYYACQYTPPHSFAVNLPVALAEARAESYARYAWPGPLAGLFRRNGTVVALTAALLVALVLVGVGLAKGPDALVAAHRGPGAFYAAIPWSVLAGLSGAIVLFAIVVLAVGAIRFWREGTATPRPQRGLESAAQAAGDVLTLRNLGGGGAGCNDRDGAFSTRRRWLHHAMFYGFLLCFAATVSAWFMDNVFGQPAPYPWLSVPVLLGTVGGVGLMVGTAGLLQLKLIADQAPSARRLLGADAALLILLFLIAASGLVLLLARGTGAMTLLLAAHFGLVLSLFLLLPYSKMVHGLYRGLALLRDRQERAAAD